MSSGGGYRAGWLAVAGLIYSVGLLCFLTLHPLPRVPLAWGFSGTILYQGEEALPAALSEEDQIIPQGAGAEAPFLVLRQGDMVSLRIRNDLGEHTAYVPGASPSPLAWLFLLALSLLTLAPGLWVTWRSDEPDAPYGAPACAALATLPLVANNIPPLLSSLWGAWGAATLGLASCLALKLLLGATGVGKPSLAIRALSLLALALGLMGAAVLGLSSVFEPLEPLALTALLIPLAPLALLPPLAALRGAWTLRATNPSAVRTAARWSLLGGMAASAMFLALLARIVLSPTSMLLSGPAPLLALGLAPLSLMLAALAGGWGQDLAALAVRRLVALALLCALTVPLAMALGHILAALTNAPLPLLAPLLASMAAVALWPTLLARVERKLFRSWDRSIKALRVLTTSCAGADDPLELSHSLASQVMNALRIQSCSLYCRQDHGSLIFHLCSHRGGLEPSVESLDLPRDHPLVALAHWARGPVTIMDMLSKGAPGLALAAQTMEELEVSALVPLRHAGPPVAFLLLGHRSSGDPLDREELKALDALSLAAAPAYERALVRPLEPEPLDEATPPACPPPSIDILEEEIDEPAPPPEVPERDSPWEDMLERALAASCWGPRVLQALVHDEGLAACLSQGARLVEQSSLVLLGEMGTAFEAVGRLIHLRSRRRGHALMVLRLRGCLSGPALPWSVARQVLASGFSHDITFLIEGLCLASPKEVEEVAWRAQGPGTIIAWPASQPLPQALRTLPAIAIPPVADRTRNPSYFARAFLEDITDFPGLPATTLEGKTWKRADRWGWPGNDEEIRAWVNWLYLKGLAGEKAEGPDLFASQAPTEAEVEAQAEVIPEADDDPGEEDLEASPGEDEDDGEALGLRRALEEAGGNKSEVARRLGINRSTLLRRLKKHGII